MSQSTNSTPAIVEDAQGWMFVGILDADGHYKPISPLFMSEGGAQSWLDEYQESEETEHV